MGVIKVPSLLCLLLLMPPLLVPARPTKSLLCKTDPCVQACHKEGFTKGFCFIFPLPVMILCFYQKQCC
ncbi:hypothetical protein ZWY2020_021582 [Hordeum vulgare]|nr:hypothetical protein ZWY2020_021582 [Hordeum vulgare]